jgi:hypothetical protein
MFELCYFVDLPFISLSATLEYAVCLDQYNKRYELSLLKEMMSTVGNDGRSMVLFIVAFLVLRSSWWHVYDSTHALKWSSHIKENVWHFFSIVSFWFLSNQGNPFFYKTSEMCDMPLENTWIYSSHLLSRSHKFLASLWCSMYCAMCIYVHMLICGVKRFTRSCCISQESRGWPNLMITQIYVLFIVGTWKRTSYVDANVCL